MKINKWNYLDSTNSFDIEFYSALFKENHRFLDSVYKNSLNRDLSIRIISDIANQNFAFSDKTGLSNDMLAIAEDIRKAMAEYDEENRSITNRRATKGIGCRKCG